MDDRRHNDHALASELAAMAGGLLTNLRASGVLRGRDLGDAGDALSHEVLSRALRAHRPDDAVLSEEAVSDPARLEAKRVWIIDPLDGTREYSERREDWAVHVALVVDGQPVAAAVALPGLARVLSTAEPSLAVSRPGGPRVAVSRSRPPAEANAVAAAIGGELVELGSAGFKAMAVVRGEVDAYVHSGGQHEWDSAAPVGVALAAGLHCSRIDGSPLIYNRTDPSLPDLIICRPELADPILEAVSA